jgi:hypothetical protein
MIRKNSKKYFRESISSTLPTESVALNNSLIKKAVKTLESFIPNNSRTITNYKRYNLSKAAYSELINFLKDKQQLNKEEIRYVKFIEQEILNIVVYKIEQINQKYTNSKIYDKDETGLSDFRQNSCKGVSNTCCYLCGKVLERHDADPEIYKKNPHYCTKRENGVCFKDREIQERQESEEWEVVLHKPKCAHCDKELKFYVNSELNNKHNGLYFCPKNKYRTKNKDCWGAYRKSKSRENIIPLKNSITS